MFRKALTATLAATAMVVPLAMSSPAQADSKPTIADVLLSDKAGDNAQGFDKSWYDFDIVTQAVLAFPDLTAAAADRSASLTVFAPNDRAFQVFAFELTGKWLKTESDVFNALKTNPALKTVLTYHIVPGKISAAAALQSDNAVLTTLQGGTIKVDVISKRYQFIVLKDADKNDLNPWIVRSKFNVGGELANGYIHGISLVLRPADLP